MLYKNDTSQRFSGRADSYDKYRPDYPDEMIGFLYQELGLDKNSVIADIGSGTGILSRYFVNRGNKTFGVEINADMRCKAEKIFADYPEFTSVDGSAENTTLPGHSVDLITAAQAFHWFKPEPTHREFSRILKSGGHVALIWNKREKENSPFLKEYDLLLKKHCPRYNEEGQRKSIYDPDIKTTFGGTMPKEVQFTNAQQLDLKAFLGRALSLSYVDTDNKLLFRAFEDLFTKYNENGQVMFLYKTRVFYEQLDM